MGVQIYDQEFGIDGHGNALDDFRRANDDNSKALVNHMEGKRGKDVHKPRPVYNPDHPDNQWPVMLHHPEKGEKAIGRNLTDFNDLKGDPITIQKLKDATTKENQKLYQSAIAAGYRKEPYVKPQIAVLSPEAEKLAAAKLMTQKDGEIAALNDTLSKALARLDALEKPPA